MKIGIELRQITRLGNSGGMAVLVRELLRAMFALPSGHEFVVFGTIFNRGLLPAVPPNVRVVTLPLRNYVGELNGLARAHAVDVLFRTFPLEEELEFPLARQVFLIPDLQHEYHPEFFAPEVLRSRRVAFTQALTAAGAIVTISEYARQTLLSQQCTTGRDIALVSPAPRREFLAAPPDLTAAELSMIPDGDFFLYPANLWPHKNHRRVLQAFRQFLRRGDRLVSLVLTGHPDGWPRLRSHFRDLPVRHLGHVRGAVLRRLYGRARALAFFSLYEGFGMPLLEAFSAGTPVICSNTTSLPEVGGDAVLACDPTDTSAMSDLMGRVLRDNDLCAALVARGKQRLTGYAWEDSAGRLLGVLECVGRAGHSPAVSIKRGGDAPLVSVVTPSFNQGPFLRRTIDSVLGQSYPNIEYLVIDGGSTDESVGILRSYGTRIRWVSERDRGQAHAINKGFDQSRGEIRAYLNSDDVLLPGTIERVVDQFARHPHWDMVYGRAHYIDEQDQGIGSYQTADYSFPRLMQDCCVCQPAAFWRTRIARRVGPFDERLHYAMDYDYWIRIDRAGGRIQHLPEVLAYSRLYPGTKTLSARRKIYREIFRVCQERAGFAECSYYLGYWHHLCKERRRGLPRLLGRVPFFEAVMAHVHHKWSNRHHYAGSATALRTSLGRFAVRLARRTPLGRLLSGLTPVLSGLKLGKRVTGVRTDNWLEPTCKITLSHRPPGQLLELGGVAPLDTSLSVAVRGKPLGVFPFRAGTYGRVSVPVRAEAGDRVVLRFSDHLTDRDGRRVAFLLQDTNLFSEHDLAS